MRAFYEKPAPSILLDNKSFVEKYMLLHGLVHSYINSQFYMIIDGDEDHWWRIICLTGVEMNNLNMNIELMILVSILAFLLSTSGGHGNLINICANLVTSSCCCSIT